MDLINNNSSIMNSEAQCVMLVDENESHAPSYSPQFDHKIGHPLRKSAFQCTESNLKRYPSNIFARKANVQTQAHPLNVGDQNLECVSPELHTFISDLKSQCTKETYLYIPIEVKDNQFVKTDSSLPVYYQTDEK